MADPRSTTAPDDYVPHLGESRQYLRDIILGINDGLVSTFLLVAGVVGGGLTATQVLLTGVAGAVAGMVSMGAGEYIATKSQEEVFEAEMALEVEHLADHRDHEREELHDMFGDMGLEEPLHPPLETRVLGTGRIHEGTSFIARELDRIDEDLAGSSLLVLGHCSRFLEVSTVWQMMQFRA